MDPFLDKNPFLGKNPLLNTNPFLDKSLFLDQNPFLYLNPPVDKLSDSGGIKRRGRSPLETVPIQASFPFKNIRR